MSLAIGVWRGVLSQDSGCIADKGRSCYIQIPKSKFIPLLSRIWGHSYEGMIFKYLSVSLFVLRLLYDYVLFRITVSIEREYACS